MRTIIALVVMLAGLCLSSGANAQFRPAGQALTPVFSSKTTSFLSYLRLWNASSSSTLAIVTLVNGATGVEMASWTTTIPGKASPQIPISEIEAAAVPAITGAARPDYYTVYVNMPDVTNVADIRYQLVVYNPSNGYFENYAGCHASGLATRSVSNVHTSVLTAYPSSLYVFNDRNVSKTLTINVYDAASGKSVGVWNYPNSVPAYGAAVIPAKDIEAAISWSPTSSQAHMNLEFVFKSSFDGSISAADREKVQHFVQNSASGQLVDVTNFCVGITYAN